MYISLCGVDPQYKLPVSMLERLSHPVSQTGPFVRRRADRASTAKK